MSNLAVQNVSGISSMIDFNKLLSDADEIYDAAKSKVDTVKMGRQQAFGSWVSRSVQRLERNVSPLLEGTIPPFKKDGIDVQLARNGDLVDPELENGLDANMFVRNVWPFRAITCVVSREGHVSETDTLYVFASNNLYFLTFDRDGNRFRRDAVGCNQ